MRETDLERHEVLNVATTLMLLVGTVDFYPSDDVEGHGLNFTAHADRLVDVQCNLYWVQSRGSVGDIKEVRSRTQAAAEGLMRFLG